MLLQKIKNFVLSRVGTALMFLGAIVDLAIVVWVLFSTQNFKFNSTFGYIHIVLGVLLIGAVKLTKRNGELSTATSEYAFALWRDSLLVAMLLGIVEVTMFMLPGYPAPFFAKLVAGAIAGVLLFLPVSSFAFALRIIANRD